MNFLIFTSITCIKSEYLLKSFIPMVYQLLVLISTFYGMGSSFAYAYSSITFPLCNSGCHKFSSKEFFLLFFTLFNIFILVEKNLFHKIYIFLKIHQHYIYYMLWIFFMMRSYKWQQLTDIWNNAGEISLFFSLYFTTICTVVFVRICNIFFFRILPIKQKFWMQKKWCKKNRN